MVFNIKRIYKGMATLRSDQVNKAIARKQDLEIRCGKESMTIAHKDLTLVPAGRIINIGQEIPSKFYVGQTYKLIDFLWQPDQ